MNDDWNIDLRRTKETAQSLRGEAAELRIVAQEVRARSHAAVELSNAVRARRIELHATRPTAGRSQKPELPPSS